MNFSRVFSFCKLALVGLLFTALAACAEYEPPIRITPTGIRGPVQPSPYAPATQPASTRSTQPGLGQVTLEDGLASLESYYATFVLTATGSIQNAQQPNQREALDAHLAIADEQSRALDAQRIIYTYSDTLHIQNNEYTEQVRLGNSSFLAMNRPGQAPSCIAQPIRQSNRWEIVPFSYSDLGNLDDAKYLGNETLSLPTGKINTRHYVIERSLLGDFPSGHAELWIDADAGYVVKLYAEASGNGPFYSQPQFEGNLVARYEIYRINQAVSIVPPTACTGDLPIMPDPQQMSVTGNLIAYQVKLPLSVVANFYTREMQERGWELASEPETTQDVSQLAFQREDQIASILLTANAAGDTVQVLILSTNAH